MTVATSCLAQSLPETSQESPPGRDPPLVAAPAATPTTAENANGIDVHAAQNPVASMISIPFQNNTYFGVGPYHKAANVLVIEPVIPFKINSEWNLISRWITPLIYQPKVSPSEDSKFGLGNLQPEFYFSPAQAAKVIWGIGPKIWLPTASDSTLGLNKWGGGPAAAALTINGPWVVGVLANNVWAGSGSQRLNQMTLNPFVDYNLPGGWYLVSSDVITADWRAKSSDRWLVPLGGGVGRVFKIGSQPVNVRTQALYNVVRPDYAPSWQLQFQIQFLFPNK